MKSKTIRLTKRISIGQKIHTSIGMDLTITRIDETGIYGNPWVELHNKGMFIDPGALKQEYKLIPFITFDEDFVEGDN